MGSMDDIIPTESNLSLETDTDSIDASLDEDEISDRLRDFVSRSNKDITSAFCEAFTKVFKTTPSFIFTEHEVDGLLRFSCQVQVKLKNIQGPTRSSKKSAKLDCCRRALEYLLESNFLTFTSDTAGTGVNFFGTHALPEVLRQHAYSKFYQLGSEFPSILGTEMVFASTGPRDYIFVICQLLSLSGTAVLDCHAEILARRGLLRFLYTQLFLYKRRADQSIFQKSNDKIKMRARYSFHLFISTPPCGDGRVYERSLSFSCNKNTGLLRYKLEKGMGTVFGDSDIPQTIDGIISGARLRIMSCSDKILKWNVLGLQGCILSKLVLPVHMSSLNIGEPSDSGSLKRAVFGRLGNYNKGGDYHTNLPYVWCSQKGQSEYSSVKPCNTSMNWNIADNNVEVVNTTTGLVDVDFLGESCSSISRLSKLNFIKLSSKLFSEFDADFPPIFSYNNLKAACVDYEEFQSAFKQRMEDLNLGIWQQLPYEISAFVA